MLTSIICYELGLRSVLGVGKTSGPCEMEGVVSDTNERYCHLLPPEPALGEGEGTPKLKGETFTNRVLPPRPGPAFPLIIIEMSPVFSI